MKRVITAVLFLATTSCLTTVEDRWCGPQLPCSPGFFCSSTFHCMLSRSVDGGSGGGTAGGGSGGGAMGGGGGAVGGGGGGQFCNTVSCASGCCLGDNCVPVLAQGHDVCGFSGVMCSACARDEGCVSGKCERVIITIDAGTNGAVGAPCFDDFECGNGGPDNFCIPEESQGQPTGFIGGYCSRLCENEMCPQGSACLEVETNGGGTAFVCFATCQSPNSCRAGYQCDGQGGQPVCLP